MALEDRQTTTETDQSAELQQSMARKWDLAETVKRFLGQSLAQPFFPHPRQIIT